MKRFHVHVAVEDIAAATRFYATLFGSSRPPPSRTTRNGCSMTRV
jgi:extradiol dioxygenase family protein